METPIKYEITPPKYESKASRLKYIAGSELFPAQAMKISGGINPNNDSEAKKIVNIIPGEKVLTIKENNELKSIINLCISNINNTNKIIGNAAFFRLAPTNE